MTKETAPAGVFLYGELAGAEKPRSTHKEEEDESGFDANIGPGRRDFMDSSTG
jgi:hypothetical protein